MKFEKYREILQKCLQQFHSVEDSSNYFVSSKRVETSGKGKVAVLIYQGVRKLPIRKQNFSRTAH